MKKTNMNNGTKLGSIEAFISCRAIVVCAALIAFLVQSNTAYAQNFNIDVPKNAENAENDGNFGATESQNQPPPLGFAKVANPDNQEIDNSLKEAEQEAKKKKLEEELREQAYEQAETGILPLNPDEIRAILKRFDETQKVSEKSSLPDPKPVVKVENIVLDPSVSPSIIKTAVGHVTSLTVLDVSGQPWPIQDVSWGGNFEVLSPEVGGHVVRITPLSGHGIGNISLRLVDLPAPVTFALRTFQDEVYYRFDARIPEFGPNSTPPIIDVNTGITAGSALLTSVLDGTPPSEARRLSVSGTDGRTTVWRVDGQVYVRTPLTLLSPGWNSSVSSSDGMTVYTVPETPVLLLSDRGNIIRASIEEQ